MKIRILLLSLIHGLVSADGIPVNEDRTHCTAPHELVKLSDDQREEVTVVGTLTLTSEQWKQLRAKSPGMPKRISTIVPCTYNDCTCGMEAESYGIWFKDGTVAVMLEDPPAPFHRWTDEIRKERCREMDLRIDERGQFYEGGVLVPYAEVKARAAWIPAGVERRSLGIQLPPHLKVTHPALAGRIGELKAISKAAGRDFWVFWSPEDMGE